MNKPLIFTYLKLLVNGMADNLIGGCLYMLSEGHDLFSDQLPPVLQVIDSLPNGPQLPIQRLT